MIAVIAFNGISPFHLSVPCAVFGEDRTDMEVPRFDLRVCAAEPGRLVTSAGFVIEAPCGLDGLDGAGTVVVPSWRDPRERPPGTLLDALRRAHARGSKIVGLCLGAFVLAEAGLLQDRPATTHWHWAELFAERYPDVRLDPDVLYVDDGDVVTSAGTAAGIDCCLHLLRIAFGADIANRVARRLVVPPHRQGGQAQYIEQPVPVKAGGDRVGRIIDWVRAHPEANHTLDALAAQAAMSRRTFTRRFRRTTGTTVGRWLTEQRLALVQQLLETTSLAVEDIAARAGFGSAATLRLHFAQRYRTSPSDYRRAFRGNAAGRQAEGPTDRAVPPG